jgi:ankyrin repeat protein
MGLLAIAEESRNIQYSSASFQSSPQAAVSSHRINVQDKDQSTCLMKASERGHLAVVQLLLNFNADVHLKDGNHRTALRIAQRGHYRNIV